MMGDDAVCFLFHRLTDRFGRDGEAGHDPHTRLVFFSDEKPRIVPRFRECLWSKTLHESANIRNFHSETLLSIYL